LGESAGAQGDHVANFGGHAAGDVTRTAASDDVTELGVVCAADFRNDFSILKFLK
jgi:hypothetical protein